MSDVQFLNSDDNDQSLQVATDLPELSGADAAKGPLLKLRRKQFVHFLSIVKHVESLRADNPDVSERDLLGWLRKEAGMSESEAETCLKFEEALGNHSYLLQQRGISWDIIAALSRSGPGTRKEVLARIERGEVINPRTIQNIESRRVATDFSVGQAKAINRSKFFEDAAAKAGDALLAKLEQASRELLERIQEVAGDPPEDSLGVDHISTGSKSEIASKATGIKALFSSLFGDIHAPRRTIAEALEKDRLSGSILWSWHSLLDLEAGKFTRGDLISPSDGRDLPEALRFLGGRSSVVDLMRFRPQSSNCPSRSLRSLDINAGIGSASLGLETAGFFPIAVYESSENARRILRDSRPVWPRRGRPYPTGDDTKFLGNSFEDIAIVTSGTIIRLPQSSVKTDDGPASFFSAELDTIKLVKPEAFLFAMDERLLDRARANFKESVEQRSRDLGYAVRWETISLLSLGLPRDSDQLMLIGMKPERLDKLTIPLVVSPKKTTLVEAIGYLVARQRKAGKPPSAGAGSDDWMKAWKTRHATKLAPPFFKGSRLELNRKGWAELDVNVQSSYRNSSTSSEKQSAYRINLTTGMMGKILGLPFDWRLEAAPTLRARYLQEAVPPAVVKATGLAVYNALSGTDYDVDKAMQEPLTRPRHVLERLGRDVPDPVESRRPRRYRPQF